MVQQPGKGHLGQGLTALPGKVIQGTDLRKALRRDAGFFSAVVIIMTFTAGSALIVFLGDQIDAKGDEGRV